MNAMRRRMHTDQGGAAAVEFALILPILMLFIFGIIEFGFIFNRWVSVTHAAREGVRVMSVGGDDAEEAAMASAPDLGEVGIACTGAEVGMDDVQMTCTVPYDFALWIFSDTITLSSTAQMRQE
jgi:Flp pilus assembly protein TadG